MYCKENDFTGVRLVESIHDGDGAIRVAGCAPSGSPYGGFFSGKSRLPVRMQVWELDPGVSEGNHVHEGEQELEEIYYFLSGRVTMCIDGEDVPVAKGDAVMVPPGADRGFRNTGEEPLRLVIIWGRPTSR